ncbi:DUF1549 domain-containing protein [Zavarzinella formosa]|uniref:DUF1549 domain-containing protein n=1 Tax=Zavarzinella formosa TaxID=360055 RepID=UPI000365E905|nr:DUF1549 domain-containing protein [Zavarzinella formosa]
MRCFFSLILIASTTSFLHAELRILPSSVQLTGKGSRQQVVVQQQIDGRWVDRTSDAKYELTDPKFAVVSEKGIVTPLADGKTTLRITLAQQTSTVPVTVIRGSEYPAVTFERDIQPILTRYGCNSGPCHGKARGQNGFALSLLGYDSDFDHAAITSEAKGRRLFPVAPENSLFLRKATGQVPHGGGKKISAEEPAYQTLLRWVASGTPRTPVNTPVLERITLEPSVLSMGFRQDQRMLVTAVFSDGTKEDVTHLSTFQSNDAVYAGVDNTGRIRTGPLPGEAAIMARYMEKFAVCNVLIPRPEAVPADYYTKLPRQNFIDGLVWAKLQQLGLKPSDPADEATFHRRIYLDIIGRLPTPEETRTYLANPAANKRTALVDRLLDRPEYGDWWANKWADLLRPNPYHVGIKAVFNLDGWLRDSFRQNKPYDVFVRELLTARGSTFRNGAAVMFRNRRQPDELTTMVSQLFLGVRLDCAKCHHHPFEIWGQNDFYSMAAYFGRLGHQGQGISAPISGGEEVIFLSGNKGEVKHPLNGKVMTPKPLVGMADVGNDDDPRQVFAKWVTSPENPFFAKVIVNRMWADFMGRGIVDPVDDLRATNPPSNGPLLDALADDFRKNGYDLKKLIRTIVSSHVYSISTDPNETNHGDHRNYSRHYRQRLRAEVLLDAAGDITGVGERFDGMPPGTRAMEAWTVRMSSLFLDSFGRPDPNQDPPCERTLDTSVVQSLHLMNSPNLHRKITADEGRAAKLAASKMTSAEIVNELYLATYGRLPTDAERTKAVARFEKPNAVRRTATEDLMWALLNTPEFVFNN